MLRRDFFRRASNPTSTGFDREADDQAAAQLLPKPNRETPMKSPAVFVLFLALTPTTVCLAQTAQKQACNVNIDVTDTDPKGTNVRATPGGNAIALLKNTTSDGWIGVHVTGQFGDWYEIDRANLIDADQPSGGKVIFQGKGYLHKSVVGISGLQNGGVVYRNHDIRTDLVDSHVSGDQRVDMLGCWGEFLKVQVKKGIGWTTAICTNMNTTCN
ncbi:hypothetical protein [Bradyrhizobium sp. CCGUVB23]|uniref:hypothetical protein n=1 Tax=Bradyrhizobium sp. CCGUVB23 TaxID=2949630 RepID=UPI0020B447FD|nr:hypothetical protein [Bradyrhizobium sp. CCGUVB23]MCP3458915.1 hypothetical protein [Bradyrhizobium sp. CCGUVB23]